MFYVNSLKSLLFVMNEFQMTYKFSNAIVLKHMKKCFIEAYCKIYCVQNLFFILMQFTLDEYMIHTVLNTNLHSIWMDNVMKELFVAEIF